MTKQASFVEIERRRFWPQGPRGIRFLCYGADDVREGVAIMHREEVDVSITGNSTNPTRFQHPCCSKPSKAERTRQGLPYFSCFRRRYRPNIAPR
ncbi:GGGtGRT protein [Vibrio lentus]|nr:GGGtGRT protein [Vibrio lentus]